MNSLKKLARNLWNDESAQGAAEYVLLVVVIVAMLAIFRKQIKDAFEARVGGLATEITNFKGDI